ncbi:DNA topoisomerase IB [Novosphingobium sp. KCTC 2891]|uniref:DNA topoisomerase IB n=1 Tax=Novosphingobium sp. KCTC 2891 TaxID=2989730 RepID=UPI0022224D75|nr:DNA topoisomerase IB [Novosphingobium sp. KCTC 2891]MCW1382697.1 DNA topoisomerase IB [Novosphingobium sp. KCTC 2891]
MGNKARSIRIGKTRLVYVDDSLPGIRRRRMGQGWGYWDADGQRITDRGEINRLNAIGLPPAYGEAWFCPAPNGHVLATGIDARGRKQYRYHPEFRTARESEKFDRTARFGHLLPLVRRRVEDDLRAPRLTRERCIASVVRLLDSGGIRVGNEAYARANASFGATTLRMRHADVRGGTLLLRFKAKSGKLREMRISDRGLVRFVKKMQDLPGQHLFQYLDDDGAACPVGSAEVNDYLRETMGDDFTAKHFRTWHASALAFGLLAGADGQVTLKALLAEVSERLGNTPAIARKSYVHPAVLALVERQEAWRAALKLPRATQWLDRNERGLIALLEAGPRAAELLRAG